MKIRKVFKMSGQMEGNTLVGQAAGYGNLDRGADVLFPGTFANCLTASLVDGFMPDTHDWTVEAMLAYPTKLEEGKKGLTAEFAFHTTQRATDAKTICTERLAAGKSIGMSVGFSLAPGGYMWFEDGDALLAMADKMKYDLSAFDQVAIKAYRGWNLRGIWEANELYEVSLCPVPMNPAAQATAIKALNDLREDGALPGLNFGEHLTAALSGLDEVLVRGFDIAQSRQGEGKHVSEGTLALIEQLAGRSQRLLAEAQALAKKTEAGAVANAEGALRALRAKASAAASELQSLIS